MSVSLTKPYAIVLAVSGMTFLLAAAPGTADVVIWKAWVDGLAESGFVTGYNAGNGHILQPPLGMGILYLAHQFSPWIGVPAFRWPDAGWTGYSLMNWAALAGGSVLVYWMTRRVRWAVLFQCAFVLSNVYGYFDILGIVPLLLALHGLSAERPRWALFWGAVAALIKWQFLVIAPFAMVYLARKAWRARNGHERRKILRDLVPATLLLALVLAALGRGTVLSLARGLAHDTLSGYALNVGWMLTWAMHLHWPESYGALEDGLITVVRTRDTRVLALVRLLFGTSFLFALWRQWCGPQSVEWVLRCMLAGYLAYFLFNRGAHENHLVPAIALAGYLAWRSPSWRDAAILITVAANLNMFFFYGLNGTDRGGLRVLFGVDFSLPLAALYVSALGVVYLMLCGVWPRDPGRARNRVLVIGSGTSRVVT